MSRIHKKPDKSCGRKALQKSVNRQLKQIQSLNPQKKRTVLKKYFAAKTVAQRRMISQAHMIEKAKKKLED